MNKKWTLPILFLAVTAAPCLSFLSPGGRLTDVGPPALPAYAKARILAPTEMVREAYYIAVIDIGPIRKSADKGDHWEYAQEATAKTVRNIKGTLPETFKINGSENFICARSLLASGTFLAFLRKDKDLFVSVNYHRGLLPVKNDMVDWYAADNSDVRKPLDKVIEEIRNVKPQDWVR